MSERPSESMLAAGLSRAFARLLTYDLNARERLARMDGLVLGVVISGPELKFRLAVQDRGLVALPGLDEGEGATISATPGAFLALAASGGELSVGQFKVQGDADTARRFQEFFAGLSPDWEEALSRVFGDVIGFQAARAVRGGLVWVRQAGRSLAENLSEYLREESRQLVTRPELEEFLDQVDELRDDVARLEARLKRHAAR